METSGKKGIGEVARPPLVQGGLLAFIVGIGCRDIP
jgi:hypothetical protein